MRPPLLTPAILVRLEGLAALAVAVLLYARIGGNWFIFLLLFLVPDISMPGYLSGPRVGAGLFNLVHTYTIAAVFAGWSLFANQPLALALALILFAHIGIDRFLGFGLKYPGGFKETHLQRL